MSANFVSDLEIVDQTTVELAGPQYPVAQWHNGDPKLAAVGGIVHTGGIALPSKYVDEAVAPPPGWARTSITFDSGKTEPVLAAQKSRLAVVRTRFRWFRKVGGEYSYYPRAAYADGMRGHTQALCALWGFDFPVVVTFKGKASQEFEKVVRDFAAKTQEAAGRVAQAKHDGPRFPRYAFYLKLSAGPHQKVGQRGQESIITPPVLDLPSVINEDYLSKVYVGREKLIDLQALFRSSADWAAAWERPGAQPDEGPLNADPETGEILSDESGEETGAGKQMETARIGGSDLWKRWYTVAKQAQDLHLLVPTLDDAANDDEIKAAGRALKARIEEAQKELF